MVVTAALATGPWFWARCGFNFLDLEQRRPVETWAQAILRGCNSRIDTHRFDHANQFALMGSSPDDDISFEDVHAALTSALGLDAARQTELRLMLAEKANANEFDMHTPMRLGKAVLLSGPPWKGILDLRGRDRRIFEDYARFRLGRLRPGA